MEQKLTLFKHLAEGSSAGHLLFKLKPDSELELIFVNTAFTEMSGYTVEELLSLGYDQITEDAAQKSIFSLGLDPERQDTSEEVEMLFYRKDKSPYWSVVSYTEIPAGLIDEHAYRDVKVIDISEKKQLASDLKFAKKASESAKEAKEKFLANISHELRTPLTGVMGTVELLNSTELNAEQKEYAETISASTQNLLLIVKDILEYSELESENIRFNEKLFNVRDLINKAFKTFRYQASDKRLNYTVYIEKDVPKQVMGDEIHLNRILLNLIGNAVKFTDSGTVELHVKKIKEEDSKTRLQFRVSDTGIGISKELQNSLFDSFSKAFRLTMAKYGGTGLGLTIVKKLTDFLGGNIDVDSKEGVGTVITVQLPFGIPNEADLKNTKKQISGPDSFENIRVLVVDDHPVNRKIVMGMLGKMGAVVDEAEDGEQAIEKIASDHYNIIFMDIHMPVMNGLEATRKIREGDAAYCSVPVVALTASAFDSDIEESRKAGMNDFLAKPFTYQELINKVRSQLHSTEPAKTRFEELDEEEGKVSGYISLSSLEEMTGGDSLLMNEMIDIFLEQTPPLLTKMEEEMVAGDLKAMGVTAHKIKPTLSYMGMKSAEGLILNLESFREENQPDHDPVILMKKLKAICKGAFKELEKIRQTI
jgi:PAS domain S-box-containing protein